MKTLQTTNRLLAAVIVVGGVMLAASASANAGHNNITGPEVFSSGTDRSDGKATAEPCYTEPTGFHSQIRWDDACRAANARRLRSHDHTGEAPAKYVAPVGFHHQVPAN